MTGWQLWVGLMGLLVIAFLAGLLRREGFVRERQIKEADRKAREEVFALWAADKDESYIAGLTDGHKQIVDDYLKHHSELRYQLNVYDFKDQVEPEMRYRWVISDADSFMKAVDEGKRERDMSSIPFMLGNAPTRALAEAEALAWVDSHDATSVVL